VIENYSVQDVLGVLRVLPFFSLVLFVPGYLIGMASNILDFRKSELVERVPLALVISSAVSPYIINILCRRLSIRTASILFLVLGLICCAHLLLEWWRSRFNLSLLSQRTTKVSLLLVAGWVLVCFVSLPDIQLGQRVYSTAATYDHSVRSALISSALRTGSPPANPFFYAGSLVPARYYYYWNVLCAIPAKTAGVTPRLTLYAGCLWCGLLFASMIPIYLKHFMNRRSHLRLTSMLGIALISITGLDLIPVMILRLGAQGSAPLPDIEWWDPVQVTSWIDALIWVPHHVASLVSCLAGFLFLWKAVDTHARKLREWLLSLAAMGFSSAAGLSIYVTFTFALFMVVWTAYLALRRKGHAVLMYLVVGCASIFLSLFYLGDLLGNRTGAGNHGSEHSFVAVSLRQLPYAISDVPAILGRTSHVAVISIYLLLCIAVLFLEFGAYFLVAVYQANHDWKHRKDLSEPEKALWTMGITALVVMIFLRSTVLQSNDLGWRAGLMLQYVLLLWTAIYLADEAHELLLGSRDRSPNRKLFNAALMCVILMGGTASLYQLWNLRTFTLLREKHGWRIPWRGAGLTASGSESFQIREAYDKLDRLTSADTIVQFNPESDLRLHALAYSRYQQVDASVPDCGISFGGSLSDCLRVQELLKTVFDPGSTGTLSKSDVEGVCRALRIKVIVVTSHDPIWRKNDSWMSEATPIVQNELVRMYRCDTVL
jgi:hypothetical protein